MQRRGFGNIYTSLVHSRHYSSKVDWNKLRPMILNRIRNRAKSYPVAAMIAVAYDALHAREELIKGVSTLLNVIPVKACKYVRRPYVYVN